MLTLISTALTRSRELVRWDHWYDSKLPLFFVLGYTLLTIHGLAWASFIACLRLVAFALFFLALGYAANDFSDREVDRRAGKSNASGGLSEWQATALLAGLFLFSFACLPRKTPLALALAGSAYFFGLFYSLPPLRFKERGMWGLLVAAAAQRSLPALLFFEAFDHWQLDSLLFGLLYLFTGLRGILGHQAWDREYDLASGVRTYATQHSVAQAQRLLKGVFVVEAGLLIWLVIEQVQHIAWLPGLLAAYAAWLAWQAHQRKKAGLPLSPYTPPWLPLHGFYFIAWPLGLAAGLAVRQPAFWIVFFANLAWQQWSIRQEWEMATNLQQASHTRLDHR